MELGTRCVLTRETDMCQSLPMTTTRVQRLSTGALVITTAYGVTTRYMLSTAQVATAMGWVAQQGMRTTDTAHAMRMIARHYRGGLAAFTRVTR